MLLELRVENYAVIDHTVAEFGPGLNLLTGETGAGKSILIDALVLLPGGRPCGTSLRRCVGPKATVCGSWICGAFKRERLRALPLSTPRKTCGWRPKSGCWRTQSASLPGQMQRWICCMKPRFRPKA